MAQQRVSIRTYNYVTSEQVPVDLEVFDGEELLDAAKRARSDDGFTRYTFTRDAGKLVRVKAKGDEWSLLWNSTYLPLMKDCSLEIACVPAAEARNDGDCSGFTEVAVELDWCKDDDGEPLGIDAPSTTVVARRDSDPAWQDSKPAQNGIAQFRLLSGHWYSFFALGYVMCPAPPHVFVCGEAPLPLRACLRAEKILILLLTDLCGKPTGCASCMVNGQEMLADESGKIYMPNPPAAVQVQSGPHWKCQPVTIQPTGFRDIEMIRGHFSRTWIRFDVESDYSPLDLIEVARPPRGMVGPEVRLLFNAAGRAEQIVALAGRYAVQIQKRTAPWCTTAKSTPNRTRRR